MLESILVWDPQNKSLNFNIPNRPPYTGESLHSQVEHHVRDKFATPIFYGIQIYKI